MKTIELTEVTALAPFLQSGDQEPIFLTRDGETVAAVVPTSEQDAESLLLRINPQFQAIIERSQRRLESEGGLASNEVRARLGLPTSGA